MQFMDQALARRIESALSSQNAAFARIGLAVNPAGAFDSVPMLGGHAVFASAAASPVNKLTGAGLSGPVTDEEFSQFEEFYRGRGVPPKLEVNPHADASLVKLLKQRGYVVEYFMSTHVRFLADPWDEPGPATSIDVEAATTETIDEFADTLMRGFLEGAPMVEAFRDMNRGLLRLAGARALLARIDGRPAGAASMCVSEGPGGPLAAFFGASTLPEYRRRGVQTALLGRRLAHARERGCDLAVVQSRPGTSSERNMARCGFRLAYHKAVMLKE